ncbi:MAG: DUF3037 domain-containing protein [Chitinophagales bacterium]
MNPKKFRYYVLKYRPSLLLDERVNIGLLFVFEGDKQVQFLYPKRLQRLSGLYKGIVLKDIKNYLREFEQKADELTKEERVFSDRVADKFLLPDSNSLFFSESKFGEYIIIDKILAYYKEKYFSVYGLSGVKEPIQQLSERNFKVKEFLNVGTINGNIFFEQHNDAYLTKMFFKQLKLKADNQPNIGLFQKDYQVKGKVFETTFDCAWQNGTTNLIKSIGFDLEEERLIQEKSFRWYGELSQLTSDSKDNKYRFDLLVSRPQDKKLFTAYDKALRILDNIETNKKIIEEDDIEEYAVEALNTVKLLKPIVFE